MARESFKNFATSALAGNITSGSTSFSVTGGSGASFPSANFVVVIDTELLFITSRSTDTFTVGTRGWDGTTAASHNLGATVQLSVCAYNFDHLWANVADTFNPLVPPAQYPLSASGVPNGSASAYDNEFESLGSWVLNPSSPAGVFSVNATVPSNIVMNRGSADSALYTAYVNFGGQAGAFTITCKMSSSLNMITQGAQESDFHFFASDQANPTGGTSVGNMMKIAVADTAASTTGFQNTNARSIRAVKVVASTSTQINNQYIFPFALPLYLRINYDGAGKWQTFFGDGVTYSLVSEQTGMTFTTNSIGFHCSVSNTTSSQIVLVDYVRAVLGTRLQYWG